MKKIRSAGLTYVGCKKVEIGRETLRELVRAIP